MLDGARHLRVSVVCPWSTHRIKKKVWKCLKTEINGYIDNASHHVCLNYGYDVRYRRVCPALRFRSLHRVCLHLWGFKGHVVSDCGAISDVWTRHKYVTSAPAAGAISIKAGTNLECGNDYRNLVAAVSQGLVSEKEIDVAPTRWLVAGLNCGRTNRFSDHPNSRRAFTHL